MSTGRLNPHPVILPKVLGERLWGERDFYLIDVGASGGLEKHWQQFGDHLKALAFEPLIVEVERLQHEAAGSKVRYEAAFVTCRDFNRLFPPEVRNDRTRSKSNDPFPRTSAARAQELAPTPYIDQMFNAGAPAVYADRHVLLDDFIPVDEQPFVDFIKIDTDGHDIEVLLGAEELVKRGGVLGFSIEGQFHGASHDYANTFSNIDRFLRGCGFTLFDLESYRYSRAALPAPFAHDLAAQTVSGQVLWGEVIYFRDLADPDYERMWPYEVTPERVLKLACLFDLFGMPDCAAELLLERGGPKSQELLDSLATEANGKPVSYDEIACRFEADPQWLFPSRLKQAAKAGASPEPTDQEGGGGPSPVADGGEAPASARELQRKVARLEKKIEDLQDRVRRRNERIDQLTRPRP